LGVLVRFVDVDAKVTQRPSELMAGCCAPWSPGAPELLAETRVAEVVKLPPEGPFPEHEVR
jgi:hypothetical protein